MHTDPLIVAFWLCSLRSQGAPIHLRGELGSLLERSVREAAGSARA